MKPFRTLALAALVLSQSGCFSILHFIDLAENGTLSVQWSFRFSKSLEEMGKKQGDKPESSGGLSSEVEKGKQEIPGKLGAVARDLKVETIQSEYDSGIRVSFNVPQFAKVDFSKVTPEEFPYMPQYVAASRQLIFHFAPVKKDKKEESKPSDTPPPPQSEGEKPADQPSSEGADDMGKQIGKLFLSSVRYQIVMGRGLRPLSATIRQEGKEKKLELQTLGEQSLLDLPLFALYGDRELPFDLVIQLK